MKSKSVFRSPKKTYLLIGITCIATTLLFFTILQRDTRKENSPKVISSVEVLKDIPSSESDKLALYYPKNKGITSKSKLFIKGITRYDQDIVIDEERLPPLEDGRFTHIKKLSHYGYHRTFFTFIKSDLSKVTLEKETLFLPALNSLPFNQKDDRYFFISKYTWKQTEKAYLKQVKVPVTRAQLAYTLFHLSKDQGLEEKDQLPLSKKNPAEKEIKEILSRELMGLYPNGNFYPEKSITYADYVLALLNLYNKSLNNTTFEMKTRLTNHHWSTPFFELAIAEKLIPNTHYTPNKKIDYPEFISLIRFLPVVEQNLHALKKFPAPFSQKKLAAHLKTADKKRRALKDAPKKYAELRLTFSVDSPLSHIHIDPKVSIKGILTPKQHLTLNEEKVYMSKKGKFTKELNLIKGKNVLNFRYNNEQKKHIKWYLDSFSDLKNHWLAKEVAILKHLNLLPNSIKDAVFFEPKKKVSHRELTEIIETIFPSKKQTRTLQFFRKKSLEEELSKELNKRGYVTKLEVLEKIINASKLTRKENQKQALPFKDLPTQESSRNNLQIAYDHKLISKATYLYPNKEITKAELFSIVYKLPHIQKEVAVFLKDS